MQEHLRRTLLIGCAVIVIFIVVLVRLAEPVRQPYEPIAAAWYSGGSLHNRLLIDWKLASHENRLATSADFVMVAGDYPSIPSDLRRKASELAACITDVAEDPLNGRKPVAEIGSVCLVLSGI